jgi:hypothetical protein
MKYSMESYVYKSTVDILVKRSCEITCPFNRKSSDINTYIKIWLRL